MRCEELGGRGNPAAFPLPWQCFPSATAVTSPQPCSSSSSRSGSVTQQCHKAQVSTGNVPSALGLKASRRLYQDKSNHITQRTFSRPEISLQGLPHLWVHKAHWSYPKAMGRNVCTVLCCFFKHNLSGKVTKEDMSTVPGKLGSLQSPPLVSSLHLSVLSLHRPRLDVLPKGLEKVSSKLLFPVP